MNIVVIFNGLGNQMSQYAFYLAKKRYDKDCIFIFDDKNKLNHNGYELDKLFGIKREGSLKYKLANRLYQLKKAKFVSQALRILGIRIIGEDKAYKYRKDLVEKNSNGVNFYWGGWPSEKHFLCIADDVRRTFRFPAQTDSEFLQWKTEIENSPRSVSLHIRRGDYLVKTNDMYQFGGVANMKYFSRSMDYINSKFDDLHFYVFSDDLDWCKMQFTGNHFHFVNCNTCSNSWRDMQLMSLCHHHINSNSTFSWWAAWLSPYNDSITICPQEYISNLDTPDVYPERWIKIDNK